MTTAKDIPDYPINTDPKYIPSKRKNSRRSQKKKVPSIDLSGLDMPNPNAAGIDVSSREHWVCVPPGRTTDNIRKFGSFTRDIKEICRFLKLHGVITVAMESTGVYWIPLFQHLQKEGFEVFLVNARHIKNVPGRTKTDKLDCQWIQKLHSFGLLRGSFHPDDQVSQLRAFLRHRDNLVALASKHIQHLQKALRLMNLLLDNVISDITGTTGMRIIQAIIDGFRDPLELAKLKDCRIRSSESEIAKSLEGDYREEQLFILQQSLEMFRYTHKKIDQCDEKVQNLLDQWAKVPTMSSAQLPPSTKTRTTRRRNDPAYDIRGYLFEILGTDLTQVPGFQENSIQTIMGEVGTDMTKWTTEKHFSSWLGLSPDPEISGGKTLKNKTKKVQSRAAKAFRLAARACGRSTTALGAFYRRLKARIGAAKAITATAHKLAIIFYKMVKNKVEYKELGEDYYSKKYHLRILKNLESKAKHYGLKLVAAEA